MEEDSHDYNFVLSQGTNLQAGGEGGCSQDNPKLLTTIVSNRA